MKQIRQRVEVQEPIGIVISDGARGDVAPKFLAYVWGPAPEPDTDTSEIKAA